MIKRKQIAFNLLDPKQKEMYEFVDGLKNFSAYGKMLIFADTRGKVVSIESPIEDDRNYLKNLI